MSNEIYLDVLIPAFNSELFIESTLNSIKDQTYKNFRVFISVDKSNDQTLTKCIDYAKKDLRFFIIEQPNRLGWVRNSNFLLNKVQAPFAVFAFHDDILHPTYFHKLINCLEENITAVNAFSDTLCTSNDGKTEHWIYSELEDVNEPFIRGLKILQQQGKWWVPNRGIFRSSVITKINGLKTHESGEFSADLPWLFHMSLYGNFIRIPETLCFKYYKSSSLSRGWSFNSKARFDVLVSCMRELWFADVSTKLKLELGKPLMDFLLKNYGLITQKDAGKSPDVGVSKILKN